MKNVLVGAACCLVLVLFFAKNIYADAVIPGEVMIKKYENIKTVQKGKQIYIQIQVYGIPHPTEPPRFKDCKECKYINAVVINQNGYSLGLANLIKIVDETQYPDGKWRGYIVVKVIIKLQAKST